MTLLVAMAVLGALLGATVRPPLLGALIAVGLTEGLRSLIGVLAAFALDNGRAPFWAGLALHVTETPIDGYQPLLGASCAAALISALLVMATTRPASTALRRVRKGRYVRTPNMIEERPVQTEAEARQKALLGL